MTRQRLAQLARNERGLCSYCENPLHPGSKSACYYHLCKRRANLRKKLGYNAQHRTGMGRPAITRLPIPQVACEQQEAA